MASLPRGPTAAVVVLVVLAGCSAGGTTTFAADAAVIAESAVAETDYTFNGTTERTVNRTVGGREVRVTSKLSVYRQSVDGPGQGARPAGTVLLLSTPSVAPTGTELNPVASLDPRALAARIAERREGLTIERVQGNATVQMLGTETTVTRFVATRSVNGTAVALTVHVTRVEHENDFVVAVATHPTSTDEAATVRRLLGAVVHPA